MARMSTSDTQSARIRTGKGGTVLTPQRLAEAAWPVCDCALADLTPRDRQTGNGHGNRRESDLLTASTMPTSVGGILRSATSTPRGMTARSTGPRQRIFMRDAGQPRIWEWLILATLVIPVVG
jgi:hypothetical protein